MATKTATTSAAKKRTRQAAGKSVALVSSASGGAVSAAQVDAVGRQLVRAVRAGAPPALAPSVNLISELNNIDFRKMIGGPLQAAVDAQVASSLASVNFINEVGFKLTDPNDPNSKRELVMVDFTHTRKDVDAAGVAVVKESFIKVRRARGVVIVGQDRAGGHRCGPSPVCCRQASRAIIDARPEPAVCHRPPRGARTARARRATAARLQQTSAQITKIRSRSAAQGCSYPSNRFAPSAGRGLHSMAAVSAQTRSSHRRRNTRKSEVTSACMACLLSVPGIGRSRLAGESTRLANPPRNQKEL